MNSQKRALKSYFRLFRYLIPHRRLFIVAGGLAFLFACANVLFMPLIRDIMRELTNKNLIYFNNQMLNGVALYAIRLISQFSQNYVTTLASGRVGVDIQVAVYRKMVSLGQDFYAQSKLGDLMTRLFDDVEKVKEGIMLGFMELVPVTLTFVGVVTYLTVLSWKLTVFTVLVVPIFVYIISYLGQTLKKVAHSVQRRTADVMHVAQETVNNIKLVQASAHERQEVRRFSRDLNRNLSTMMKGVRFRNIVEPTISYLQFLVIVGVVWYGGYEMAKGSMTGPELASYFGGLFLLVDPVLTLSKLSSNMSQAFVSADRILDILDTPATIGDGPEAKPMSLDGNVAFKSVSFAYNATAKPVLADINLEVKKGEVVALVGPSGAGKSTFINLIPRFWEVSGGQILFDGHPIEAIALESLRSQIAIVPQDDILFRGTVLDNVRYGRPDATQDQVIAACKSANAWEFIDQLPKKLFTRIGDRGQRLSGGQKQRISIARAILRDPRILILDEATSALDSESESLVQSALAQLMAGRTTFVIAHRLDTIRHADKIVVLENGRIVAVGTHDALMAAGGRYEQLYSLQFSLK